MSQEKIDAGLFGASELFKRTYREGMALVEQTALYLDGDGREEAKNLPRDVALAYATESMRLTTRLMQVAAWLLVQKAVSEGEMTPDDAAEEKYRLDADSGLGAVQMSGAKEIPQRLQDLIGQSFTLYQRVLRLDGQLHVDGIGAQLADVGSPLAAQFARAEAFFQETCAEDNSPWK